MTHSSYRFLVYLPIRSLLSFPHSNRLWCLLLYYCLNAQCVVYQLFMRIRYAINCLCFDIVKGQMRGGGCSVEFNRWLRYSFAMIHQSGEMTIQGCYLFLLSFPLLRFFHRETFFNNTYNFSRFDFSEFRRVFPVKVEFSHILALRGD